MELIHWILVLFAVLAVPGGIWLVRIWNGPAEPHPLSSGPQIRFTAVGWLVALATVGMAAAVVVGLWWCLGAGVLRNGPPWRPSLGLAGGAALVVGLIFFFSLRGLLGCVGIRLWIAEEGASEEAAEAAAGRGKKLRYRLQDQHPTEESKPEASK